MNQPELSSRRLIARIWSDSIGYRPQLLALLLLHLLAAPLTLAMPLPIKICIDNIAGTEPLPPFLRAGLPEAFAQSTSWLVVLVILMIFCIALLSQLRSLGAAMLQHYVAESLVLRFRARLLEQAQRISLAFHDTTGTANSLYRIQFDGTAPDGVLVNGLMPMATSVATAVAMGIVTTLIDWQLALTALAAGIPLIVVTRAIQPILRKRWGDSKALDSSVLAIVQESLASLRIVRAYGQEQREQTRFVDRGREAIRARLRAVLTECLFGVVVGLIFAAGTAGVMSLGVLHAHRGTITLGDLTLVMFYLLMLYQPLESIGTTAAALQSSLASADRAYALLDEPYDVDPVGGRPLEAAKGEIEFREVSFAYDERRRVLDNVSLMVPAGSQVGIAGTTGAGKSTLVTLLLRFFDPVAGQILLDGVDLREYRVADLRKQISIVLQDTILFSTTIAENISYGCPDAAPEAIVESARQANAHEFISRLPDGYETQVGERGAQLSGGERQRIALARAFLRDSPILILDEPTSAVDTKTETLVLQAIERLMQGRTTFIISHRPNTLDYCDIRVQLEAGRIESVTGSVTL